MGFLDDQIKSLGNAVKDAVEGNSKRGFIKNPTVSGSSARAIKRELIYQSYGAKENWYQALPYGFRFIPRGSDAKNAVTMYLPISPSNLNITTHFATNIITTLYGTVEEHSEVRYFDIQISGTTGIAPRYVAPVGESSPESPSQDGNKITGRQSSGQGFSVSLGGFFQQSVGIFNQIVNQANTLLNGNPTNSRGLNSAATGYIAFHNLYKVLMQYKLDAAGIDGTGERVEHPLQFLNYKDNNQYDCAVVKFVLKRDASNPMLYNYDIVLRAYNLKTLNSDVVNNELLERSKILGIDGVNNSSYFNKAKDISNRVKGILGGARGGVDVLGR